MTSYSIQKKSPISCNIKLIFPLTDFYSLRRKEEKKHFITFQFLENNVETFQEGRTTAQRDVKEKIGRQIVTQQRLECLPRSQFLKFL